jgi:hypothetical protein
MQRTRSSRLLDATCPIEWSYPLNRGLIADWTLCPLAGWQGGLTLRDLVRGGKTPHDSTLVNGPLWVGSSQPGSYGAVKFDGTNDYIRTPSLNLSAYTKLTVAFWLWWDAFANNDKLALESSINFNNNAGGILCDPNDSATAPSSTFAVCLRNSAATNNNFFKFTRPSAAAWHHYVITFDTSAWASSGTGTGAITAIYVDSKPQTNSNTAVNAGSAPAGFGNYTWYLMSRAGTSLFGAGRLDGLMLWAGRTLSRGEVRSLYSQSRGGNQERWRWLRTITYSLPPAPDTPVSDSDTGTVLEQVTLTLVGNEAGDWSEQTTLAISLEGSDTSAGVEQGILTASTAITDTGTGVEQGALALAGSDAGVGVEQGTLAAALTVSAAAAWQEQATLTLTGTDAVAGVEQATLSATLSGNDAVTGQEQSVLALARSDTDTWGEQATVVASLVSSDTGTVLEPALLGIPGSDTSVGIEQGTLAVSVATSDTANTSEGTGLGISSPEAGGFTDTGLTALFAGVDTGTALEQVVLAAAAQVSDTGVGGEQATLAAAVTLVTTGTLLEQGTLAATLPGSDASTWQDQAGLAQTGSEIGTWSEQAALAASQVVNDTGTLLEQGTLVAAIAGSDAGAWQDIVTLAEQTITGSDTGTSTQQGVLTASLAGNEAPAWQEQATLAVSLVGLEAGTLLEQGTLGKSFTTSDTVAWQEQATAASVITSTDTAGTSEGVGLGLLSQDTGSGIDASILATSRNTTDTFLEVEIPLVRVGATDQADWTETPSPNTNPQAQDTGLLLEGASLATLMGALDSAGLTEAASPGTNLQAQDTGLWLDVPSLVSVVVATDATTLTETSLQQAAFQDSDTGISLDSILIEATLSSVEQALLQDSGTVLLQGQDLGQTNDLGTQEVVIEAVADLATADTGRVVELAVIEKGRATLTGKAITVLNPVGGMSASLGQRQGLAILDPVGGMSASLGQGQGLAILDPVGGMSASLGQGQRLAILGGTPQVQVILRAERP